MTLEQLIRECPEEWGIVGSEYRIAVQDDEGGRLHILVHPYGRSGETVDFTVNGNELTTIFDTKIIKL